LLTSSTEVTVNLPLIHDIAGWVQRYGRAVYEQGKNAGHAEQFAKDREEGID
jgi:hypothetical protein